MHIKELGLSARSYNALYRNGIDTVQQLQKMSEEDLQKIRNLGAGSIREIIAKLQEV